MAFSLRNLTYHSVRATDRFINCRMQIIGKKFDDNAAQKHPLELPARMDQKLLYSSMEIVVNMQIKTLQFAIFCLYHFKI